MIETIQHVMPGVALALAMVGLLFAAIGIARSIRTERKVNDLIETLQATPRAHDSRFDIL